ncbi:hypothetical protein [Oryza sativa Japonica Group]|uniref:Os01g0932950 protein n=4 Tax=Oryza TaxID=4527 RepID=Q7F5I5_ORYSJ|nr:protein RALF-like 33 [Oryza sativa Japonica Group]EAY77112.1 hypothetical protein OsI_05072 [Oryza sativa Indica Group]KAB8085059.1 hypothetical protein EE612_007786 [Oryza sativa]KAF2954159.1 hypothetical protein DAI22_01g459966 [Oryza sativa Japonica Group]BAB67949.1 hypothetical protein [Oryza sativa Japonica Group]BAB93242.1 hypothetical protein [Oryza sativa Japonica Group]
MPPPRRAALAAAAVLLLLVVAAATAQAVEVAPYCVGEPGEECVAGGGGEEAVAVAAAARRRLQGGGYISYDAMRRNAVPCSYRGASYYNCRPGGQANPYTRGCSAITQCRG